MSVSSHSQNSFEQKPFQEKDLAGDSLQTLHVQTLAGEVGYCATDKTVQVDSSGETDHLGSSSSTTQSL